MSNERKAPSASAVPAAVDEHGDTGITLVEILITIVILGILAAVVVFATGGVTSNASDVGCDTDERQLLTAYGIYVTQTGNDSISPTGVGNDRYEQTLVDGGFLSDLSEMNDLDADGGVSPQSGSSC
jgi:general secretion pathway protein G